MKTLLTLAFVLFLTCGALAQSFHPKNQNRKAMRHNTRCATYKPGFKFIGPFMRAQATGTSRYYTQNRRKNK